MKSYQWFFHFLPVGLLALCGQQSFSAEIIVSREFIYPETYDPPQISVGGGSGGAVVIAAPSPSGFKTKTVGTALSVTAYIEPSFASAQNNQNLKSSSGTTDLMIAAAKGEATKVKALLDQGTDINARNKAGSTALMGAAAGGYINIVQILLGKGANFNAKNDDDRTALMFAASNGHLTVVQALLDKSADVTIEDKNSKTALMYAVTGGHEKIVQLLKNLAAPAQNNLPPTVLADPKK